MRELTRVSIPLSKDEFFALQERAEKEYRHPRDQARYMLRAALGLTDQMKHNGAGLSLASETGAVVTHAG